MSRERHSVDQIIGKLRQADVELGQARPSRKPAAAWRSPCRPTTAGVRSTAAYSRRGPADLLSQDCFDSEGTQNWTFTGELERVDNLLQE